MYFNNLLNRLRKYVHVKKRGHDCRTGLMESHRCEKILILRILQDSVPSLLPLHINMEKITRFPWLGKTVDRKIDLLEFHWRSFEISRSMRDWIPRCE